VIDGEHTAEQLLRYIRDAGIPLDAPIVIQAYGKAAKHYEWTLSFVAGELVICADLARRERRCPICGGSEFEPALDNFDESYSGCVRCAFGPGPMP
jgi:hypothetical protein